MTKAEQEELMTRRLCNVTAFLGPVVGFHTSMPRWINERLASYHNFGDVYVLDIVKHSSSFFFDCDFSGYLKWVIPFVVKQSKTSEFNNISDAAIGYILCLNFRLSNTSFDTRRDCFLHKACRVFPKSNPHKNGK